MKLLIAIATLVLGGIYPGALPAQDLGAVATIVSVKTALDDVFKRFNTTIASAGNEARSAGASLTKNAGNLLSDINQKFGARMNEPVANLPKLERLVIDDAVLLTQQIEQAMLTMAKTSGEEARIAIAEADITAYNASFSLPCRDWVPRVLYVTPNQLRPSDDMPVVKVRGNFLDIGKAPAVTLDGYQVAVVARSRNEIQLEIPQMLAESIDHKKVVRIGLPLEQIKRYGVAGVCRALTRKVAGDLSAAITLRPNVQFKVSGKIAGMQGTFVYADQPEQKFSRADNDCDASYDVNQEFCVPAGWLLDKVIGWAIHSANCQSSVSSPQASGGSCVVVPAHLGGCGYDNFLAAKNCRGSGLLDYSITLRAKQGVHGLIETWSFTQQSAVPLQKTFVFTHPRSKELMQTAEWLYELNLEVREGKKAPYLIQASHTNPNPENVVTRMVDGVLTVEIKPLPTW